MSADTALLGSVCVLVLGTCGLAHAADQEEPDPAFIEYLGMWEESDEEWQMMDSKATVSLEEQGDTSPQEKESVEKEDEV